MYNILCRIYVYFVIIFSITNMIYAQNERDGMYKSKSAIIVNSILKYPGIQMDRAEKGLFIERTIPPKISLMYTTKTIFKDPKINPKDTLWIMSTRPFDPFRKDSLKFKTEEPELYVIRLCEDNVLNEINKMLSDYYNEKNGIVIKTYLEKEIKYSLDSIFILNIKERETEIERLQKNLDSAKFLLQKNYQQKENIVTKWLNVLLRDNGETNDQDIRELEKSGKIKIKKKEKKRSQTKE
jgi:hypothetical protein